MTKRLRFIPTDLRVVVPVHFPAMFTQHERMPTLNTLDAGIVAHEAADRIDALEECLRECVYVMEHDVTVERSMALLDKLRALLESQ